MSGNRNIAERHGIAIADDPINLHRWKPEFRSLLLARIVTSLKQGPVGRPGDQLRAGFLLQLSKSTGVVEVGVGVEQIFDVGDLEAELCNAAFNLRRCLGECGID